MTFQNILQFHRGYFLLNCFFINYLNIIFFIIFYFKIYLYLTFSVSICLPLPLLMTSWTFNFAFSLILIKGWIHTLNVSPIWGCSVYLNYYPPIVSSEWPDWRSASWFRCPPIWTCILMAVYVTSTRTDAKLNT